MTHATAQKFALTPIALTLIAVYSAPNFAQTTESETVDPIERLVVVGSTPISATEVVKDPRAPQQPLPAQDGADYLKSISGFSMARKGGTSGEAVFRGAGGSRLTVTSEQQMLLGGCSSRMDPPTAYINPTTFDQIRVIKGPQSVLYGPSHATVLFERNTDSLGNTSSSAYLSYTAAQFGRQELNADLLSGSADGYLRFTGNYSESDDYKTGAGNLVNSAYQRWSGQLTAAYTPSQNEQWLVSIGASDGEAAYADRAMDGVEFARQNAALSYRRQEINAHISEISAQIYFGYIDHLMDNYSLRTFTPTMMMANPAASNPDRYTRGFRLQADLTPSEMVALRVGADGQNNDHRDRRSMNQLMMPYELMPRTQDASFSQFGVFAEADYRLDSSRTVFSGLRLDQWRAKDWRETVGMMSMASPNPTANLSRSETLTSAFVRFEQEFNQHLIYAGLGSAERFPDYWELVGNSRRSMTSASAFLTASERLNQLDLGWRYQEGGFKSNLSMFANRTNDYILIQQSTMGEIVRNIDTQAWGFEADLVYQLSPAWRFDSSLAYVHGTNRSDDRALAQQPPLEFKLAGQYQWQDWTFSGLWRVVARQDRIAPEQGTIVGFDSDETPGFSTFALNLHYQLDQQWQLSMGIDNLFDRDYSEHLNHQGGMIPGYPQLTQIPEPGRTWWVKLDYQL
ncbi:TonB-dependent copper receptor [Pseudidiomarina taiwanensis]|uniref:TonB-dependent copper receptor n=1 Tax=Pseudidiomarina taiwanensis TaxID=337250 RepID=A0A432ZEP3_9GAMM|nr:TonB-dependent copper receptor [Pseudidiomarina taiwanensis]RUO76369.1 TonB-dependent copper receptor [Pseudidiomarina taiwanensis]